MTNLCGCLELESNKSASDDRVGAVESVVVVSAAEGAVVVISEVKVVIFVSDAGLVVAASKNILDQQM